MRLPAKVVKGQQLGRKLGFPTINLVPVKFPTWDQGVYACWVCLPDVNVAVPGALHWGPKKGSGEEPVLEVHLLAFSGDLYGEEVEVELVDKIRDVMEFADLGSLKIQIAKDVNQVQELLFDEDNDKN